jgi:hypothetical protein
MVKGQHGAMALKQQLMTWQRFRHLNQQMYVNLLIITCCSISGKELDLNWKETLWVMASFAKGN